VSQPGLRFLVLQRDGFRCRYCGRTADEVKLHADHVVPRAKGGQDTFDNLVAACSDCNLGKRDVLLTTPALVLPYGDSADCRCWPTSVLTPVGVAGRIGISEREVIASCGLPWCRHGLVGEDLFDACVAIADRTTFWPSEATVNHWPSSRVPATLAA
jgi:hypothetical protein